MRLLTFETLRQTQPLIDSKPQSVTSAVANRNCKAFLGSAWNTSQSILCAEILAIEEQGQHSKLVPYAVFPDSFRRFRNSKHLSFSPTPLGHSTRSADIRTKRPDKNTIPKAR